MKVLSSKATLKREVVDKLFGTPEAARETTRKILEQRDRAGGRAYSFKSAGVTVRTCKPAGADGK